MKYIECYSIFESKNDELYYDDISILREYIHSMCDGLNLLYIDENEVKHNIPDGYNGIFYLNHNAERFCFLVHTDFYLKNSRIIREYLVWFKQQINQFSFKENILRHLEIVRYKCEDNLSIDNIDYRTYITELFDGQTLIKNEMCSYRANIIIDIIREFPKLDKLDKKKMLNEIRLIDKNTFVMSFYQQFANRAFNYDYEMFSAYKNDKNKLVDIIDYSKIKMPHNLDVQFLFDAFPFFFEKVYVNSGLICRINYSKFSENKIVNSSIRLRQCPKEEIETILKKYNIEMKWNEILISI